ncbi:MAG: hypothetical protein KGM43_17630 [Planctomycetota bacterium]|nr:hypothetical protein [Planctomycetota bacterium]
MTDTVDTLAKRLGPRLQEAIEADKDTILGAVHGLPARLALRAEFPALVSASPELLKSALTVIVEEFGRMDVRDLLEFLSKAKG